jgi:dTDP-4-dehydrorhamnose reductase
VSDRVLLLGSTGFLGHHLRAELARRGLDVLTAGRRGADLALDLEEPEAIPARLRDLAGVRVLHAAALSSLASCEASPERASRVNTVAAARLAEVVVGALLYVSTDLVFDGTAAPYRAGDPPRPRSVYGRTKAEAEAAVLAAGGRVARLPLLFGPSFDGRRGATDMIRASTGSVTLYTNEHRTPLHVADAARGLVELLLEDEDTDLRQLAGHERVSRYELGLRFVASAGLPLDRIRPGENDDPLRPRDVSLVSDWRCPRSLEAALLDA